jgi:hypothetical protein
MIDRPRSSVRIPSPQSKNVLFSAGRFLWTLPTNLVGHAVGLFVSRSRPVRIGSRAAAGWLYLLPPSRRKRFGAIALGDAVISSPELLRGERGRLVLAHELSHVRQHSWLGPFYLPLHGLAQLASIALHALRPRGTSPLHAYNPLEQRFLCVPFDALAGGEPPASERNEQLFDAFGV